MRESIVVLGMKEYEAKKPLSSLSTKEFDNLLGHATNLLPILKLTLSPKEEACFDTILFELEEVDYHEIDSERNTRIYNQYVFEELKILFLTHMTGVSKELKATMKKMLIDMSDYQYVIIRGKDL